MKQTKAPKLTPSPSTSKKSRAVVDKNNASQVFISMVLDMTWRLAIVVLAPVISGVELDKHFKTGQLYLIIGLAIGIILACLVVYRSYKLAGEMTKPKGKNNV